MKHFSDFIGPTHSVIRPSINLLRDGYQLASYLTWSVTRDRAVSKANLSGFKNKYLGRKAVILCNGPSLMKSDLYLLGNIYTIGLNKINLLFDHSSFRPSLIVAVNPFVISQNLSFFQETTIPVILDQKAAREVGIHADNTRSLVFSSGGHPGFSCDARYAVNQGVTVTYVALQIAYFLGFKQVTLIGCDHNFITKGLEHKIVVSGEADPNHFDPRYFSGGVSWQLPSIAESEENYMKAKRYYSYDQRMIYNSTVGGRLEIYPRISLEEFLAL